jgi:hypothetical protein
MVSQNSKVKTQKSKLYLCCTLLLMYASVFAQYHCDWYVFNTGGVPLSSADFQATTSISQTAIGYLTGTDYLSFIGFWQVDTFQVGIEKNEPQKMSELTRLETKLSIIKPNPFKTNTRINFSIKRTTHTKLQVYDRTGRIVRNLVDGDLEPGVYTINWRGDNDYGRKNPVGIYFLKFNTDDYQKIKKLLLVR